MNEPLVTIGLVVYNGEKYLADACQSILDQTYRHFRLVIYDNASTDGTFRIASEFADRDERILVCRHDRNIGALANFLIAAERAQTPYFCWAAHDDLREPQFLQALVELLERIPEAGLASCDAVEIDPHATSRKLCVATSRLNTTVGLTPVKRLTHYLRYSPCSPIYGVFRTEPLQSCLHLLSESRGPNGEAIFGADLVFLAGIIKQYDIVMTHQPLLLLRAGGVSHREDSYPDLRSLVKEFYRFAARLAAVTQLKQNPFGNARITLARWRLLCRYATWPPLVRMFMRHLYRSLPVLQTLARRWALWRGPFNVLRRRARRLPRNTQVLLYGAGKHTRRNLDLIQLALSPHARITAIADDFASATTSIGNTRVIPTSQLNVTEYDIIVISSDAYEQSLYWRAAQLHATDIPIWCIYDRTLECCARNDSAVSSVCAKSDSMASIESVAAS